MTHLTIVPTPTPTVEAPFLFHLCWTDTDESPQPHTATLDDLHAAKASVWRELGALELERDLFVVQGFRYNDYRVATIARAKIQDALLHRLDRIETAIAHAGSVQ